MEEKKRVRLWVAYDGTNYSGWQIQPNALTIEGELDRAISRLTQTQVHVIGASRTDAGVHALGNVAVFDTTMRMPAEKFCYALNSFLPEDIVVQASQEVCADWHPRHCDCEKTYEYHVWRGRFANPLRSRYCHHVYGELNLEAMQQGASYMVGTHDFSSFCAAATVVEDKVRTVYAVELLQQPDELVFRVRGNGFLYHMVRIMVGTLLDIGQGRLTPCAIPAILEAKDRTRAGLTAPAKGLVLREIHYL